MRFLNWFCFEISSHLGYDWTSWWVDTWTDAVREKGVEGRRSQTKRHQHWEDEHGGVQENPAQDIQQVNDEEKLREGTADSYYFYNTILSYSK